MDFSQWETWAMVGGIILLIAGIGWGILNHSLKGLTTAFVVVVVGVAFVLVAAAFPAPAASVVTPPTPVAGASVIVTVPTGSYGNEIGSANSPGFSVNTATHTITGTMFWNSTASAFHTKTTAGSLGTFTIPIVLSRSDGMNSSAGFNIVVSSIPTQANTTNGILYSPIAYTPATGSSAGVWSILYTNGSLNGAHPSVAAPSTTTMNADLLGVSAFGSGGIAVTFTLGGPGFYNLQVPQYSSFSFTITVTNSATGVSQGTYTVTLTDASAPPTGTL